MDRMRVSTTFKEGDYVELGVRHIGTMNGTFVKSYGEFIVLLTPRTFGDTETTTSVMIDDIISWKTVHKAA